MALFGIIFGGLGADLSAAGHAVLARAFPEWRKAQARVRRKLGAAQADRLVRALTETVETLA